MNDASETTPIRAVVAPNVSQRAKRWLTALSLERREALKFGLLDLAIAVGKGRELSELETEYSKSLASDDKRRAFRTTGRTLAQDHIKRMFADNQPTSNAWNMELVVFLDPRPGSKRVSLTTGGYELAEAIRRARS